MEPEIQEFEGEVQRTQNISAPRPRMSNPRRQSRRMRNEASARSKEQLLLDIPRPAAAGQRRQRPCSPARAAWWFQQMRQVVDKGIEVNAPGVR